MKYSKEGLYGALVAEIARSALSHYPLEIDQDGKLFEPKGRDRLEIRGCVFHHSYTSSFEYAAYLLWALEAADPVMPGGAGWQPAILDQLKAFPPYFRLRYSVAEMADPTKWDAECAFPSLDYVLSVYLDAFDQTFFPLVEARKLLATLDKPIRELEKLVDEALPEKYSGEPRSIPNALSNTSLLAMLEDTGYVARRDDGLVWTAQADKVLRAPPSLVPAGVATVDGRPRLVV